MRSVRAIALAAVLAGCSGGSRVDGSDASAPLPTATGTASTARSLARTERSIAEVLTGRIAFHPAGSALETHAEPFDLGMRVAAHAAEPTRIGTDDDHSLFLSLEGAGENSVELEEGTAIHRDVFAGTDALWATTEARAELLFLLRDERAPTHFRVHLERGPGLTTVERSTKMLSFRDARGTLRLQIPTPIAIDANGTRREATFTLSEDEHTLDVTLDDSGLVRPILLDPAVLQARWVQIGDRGKRTRGSLSWDTGRKKLLAFGGYVPGSYDEPGGVASSLYAYSFPARTFDPLADITGGYHPGSEGGSPPYQQRAWYSTFDSTRGKLLAFGSYSGKATGKMLAYEWDSATNAWTQLCTGACATTAPTATQGSVNVVYDESRKITILCLPGFTASCWSWNGATNVWQSLGAFPTSMNYGGFYDTSYGGVHMLGGDGTYAWNGLGWVRRSTSTVGPIGVTYDTIRKRGIAVVANGLNSDTYEWNGVAWSLVVSASADTPFNKMTAAMGFDRENGRAVLWGGGEGEREYWYFDFIGTVWEYQAFGNACAGDGDCLGGSCRDGFCCDSKCGACRRCDGPGAGGVCAPFAGASTGTEHDVCTGVHACDPTGSCKSKNGQACSAGTDCLSGACVDGFCCNTPCNQACEVCNATPGTCTPAAKGSAGRAGCGTGTCNGTLRTCSTACATDADCSATGYCNAGTCVATFGTGTACARDRQCTSGACTDGFCCTSAGGGACNGPCETCAKSKGATANGICTSLPASATPIACGGYACSGTSGACASACATDGECASGYYCDGTFCQKGRTQGNVCTKSAQCASGLTCSDGVCCNSACDGLCQACSAANKASGDASGVCGPAKVGSDPGDRCATDDPSTCGKTGVCSATGTCALYAKGAACGGVSCDAGTAKGRTCDGLGTCIVDTKGTACAPGTCSTTAGCTFACTTDAKCDAAGFCDSGTCVPRSPAGRTCTANNQCASGFCVDGVCCGTACSNVCEACNGVGTEGTCTAVAGPPREGHGACPGASSDDACTAAACDGSTRESCKAFAGPEVTCRAASCVDAKETLASKCDGSGLCPAPSSRTCAPFACAGTRCVSACTKDEECAPGNRCDVGSGKCLSNGTCDGDHTIIGADGSKTDCTPYRCDSSGCKTACTTTDECSAGSICDGDKCVAPAGSTDSGGCTTGRPSSRHPSTLILIALVLAARRRSARKGAR